MTQYIKCFLVSTLKFVLEKIFSELFSLFCMYGVNHILNSPNSELNLWFSVVLGQCPLKELSPEKNALVLPLFSG